MSDFGLILLVLVIVFGPFVLAELVEERWANRTWPFSKRKPESVESRMRKQPGRPH